MDERMRKIGLVSIAGVVVHMRQPLPRFWVIVYVCKLLGFSSIFSVYSCILIRVSTFSEGAPWLLNCCMAFRALTERSVLKLRQEVLKYLYSGVCWQLYCIYSTSMLKHTVLQLNGVLCWWFHSRRCVPDHGWPGRWATEGYRSHQ